MAHVLMAKINSVQCLQSGKLIHDVCAGGKLFTQRISRFLLTVNVKEILKAMEQE